MSDTPKPALPEPVATIVALAAEHAKADKARFECERYIACYEDGPQEQADLRRLTAASETAYEAFVSGIRAAIDAAVAEARAEQPCEPDMRHPKIQALIGSRARLSIELNLVEQLLDNPDCDLTALDMEYWNGLHDKLLERLTAAHPASDP